MTRSSSPKVKAAVLERPRRSTAGQRLSSLVGKAQEEDEAFWSHSIWNEKGGGFADGKRRKKRRRRDDDDDEHDEESEGSSSSEEGSEGEGSDDDDDDDGEGSYRMSEDDPSMAEDQFDSDFDESESDDDNEMVGEEEYDLIAEEKRNAAHLKRKKNERLLSSSLSSVAPPPGTATTGRQVSKNKKNDGSKAGKKGVSSSKRGPMGTGWNEGLILNWNAQYPLPALGAGVAAGLPPPSASSSTTTPMTSSTTLIAPSNNLSQLSKLQSTSIPADSTTIAQRISELPSSTSSDYAKQINVESIPHQSLSSTDAAAAAAPPSKTTSVKPPSHNKNQKQVRLTNKQLLQQSISERKKSQRRKFTQEELILEAVQFTETTNAKWILARQRSKEEALIEKSTTTTASFGNSITNRNLVSRFYSRRGCNNVLTFMDMDHLPQILVRGERQLRHSRSPSFGDGTAAGPISSPSLEPSESANKTLESCESTTAQQQPLLQHQSATDALERTYEKCIITGKIAKYRDPKSMLGYHDVEAYKELKRKLESGEIVPKVNHVQNGNETESGLSNKCAKGKGRTAKDTPSRKRGAVSVVTRNYFPFADDQPTMIAKIASSPSSSLRLDSVKVMVTQHGMPVSPPTSPSRSLYRRAELPKLLEDDKNQPPELMLSTEHNGNAKISALPVNNVPTIALTNEIQPMASSANPLFHQTNKLEVRSGFLDTSPNNAENENRNGENGIKPLVTVNDGSGSASDTSTLPLATGGGSMEKKIMDPNSNTLSGHNISNTKISSDGTTDKVIIPDVTATNDKRTTIEAN